MEPQVIEVGYNGGTVRLGVSSVDVIPTPPPPPPPPVDPPPPPVEPPPVIVIPPPPPPAPVDRQLQKSDMVYEGSCWFPSGDFNGSRFGYGGMGLAFDRKSGTCFVVGHDQHQKVAEFELPQFRTSAFLPVKVIQPFSDPTDGKWATLGDRSYVKCAGILPWDDTLIVSNYNYYDANGAQPASHFRSGRNMALPSDAFGPVKVGALKTGYTSGYMGLIPRAWQDRLGGFAFTGNCCLNIISRTSYGPAVFSFNPDDVGTRDPVPAAPLVYYPAEFPLSGPDGWSATSPLFNGTTLVGGVVMPEGSSSVLFFGEHGIGTFCYGTKCYPGAGQGTHVITVQPDGSVVPGPVVTQVWAYDANDLAAAKSGLMKPWEVKPYATWSLTLPVLRSTMIRGASYDPATNRILLTQRDGETLMLHAYKVTP